MFKSGQSGNPKGRPKGARGKYPESFREQIKKIWADNLPQIQKDLNQLEPKERLMFLEKLLQYILPKEKNEIEVTTIEQAPETRFNWEDIPEDLLCQVADAMQEAEHRRIMAERGDK